jgi:hypothetical protein
VTTIALSKFFEMFPPIDAVAVSETQCLLLLSQPPDPMLPDRHSALLLVDRVTSRASVLGEFPGAAQLVLWAVRRGNGYHALVSSPGGHLWELQPDGQVRHVNEAFGKTGPETYGYLNCCVMHNDSIFVGGMSNQLYSTPLEQVRIERQDELLLDRDMDDADAAIYGLASLGDSLIGVGGAGMILWMRERKAGRLDSGTNVMLNAACAVDVDTFVACGAGGVLLQGSLQGWVKPPQNHFSEAYFSDVRRQGRQLLWIGGRKLYVSEIGDTWADLADLPGTPSVSQFARGGTSTWVVSPKLLGWTDSGKAWTWLPIDSIVVGDARLDS